MSGLQISPIRRAWYRWKALRLPWRKRFLVGLDLHGNTYWEFHDAITTGRMRRIVEYPSHVQYSDIRLTPQWHQWLRHTRRHPPSLAEQSQDLARQEQLKILARRADERWRAKDSYLDAPSEQRQRRLPATTQVRDPGADVDGKVEDGLAEEGQRLGVNAASQGTVGGERESGGGSSRSTGHKQRDDPWKRARGGPSEEWQPQAWSGDVAPRRR